MPLSPSFVEEFTPKLLHKTGHPAPARVKGLSQVLKDD